MLAFFAARHRRKRTRRPGPRRHPATTPAARVVAEAVRDHEVDDRPGQPLAAAARHEAERLVKAQELAAERLHHPVLGKWQAARATDAYNKLGTVDMVTFQEMLALTESNEESAYLHKALAAGRTMAEIQQFFDEIHGQDATWMQDNLKLTGDSSGGGIRQQFENTCNVTTVQALRGELDPIYALQVHKANPDMHLVDEDNPYLHNPSLAREQQELLETGYEGAKADEHGEVIEARPLDDEESEGRSIDDLLTGLMSTTGFRFEPLDLEETGISAGDVLDQIDQYLRAGVPIPIVVGDVEGDYHQLLLTGLSDGPPLTYTIHEPTEGQILTRTREQFETGQLGIGTFDTLTDVELPIKVD